tara:strand:- start:1325 stop:1720 length:396 start_codon:yes stop_codon:yes gene_type:complete
MKLRDLLKEYTDRNFSVPQVQPAKGNELKMAKKLLPTSIKTARQAIEYSKAFIAKRVPVFVHVAYSEPTVNGQKYFIHQTQYYNHHFKELKGVTSIMVKIREEDSPTGKDIPLGTYLTTTDSAQTDFKKLK